MSDYFLFYKPFEVLSQFTSEGGKRSLKDIALVPVDVYPVGRLDYDSEGLLLLTNDKTINHRLLHPSYQHEREYWVQVEGAITEHALAQLKEGVLISTEGKKEKTKKCEAFLFTEEPDLPERLPPIRFRKNIPTSWIRLIIREGKNRQVRKMTAATGFPTLRLVRWRIEQLSIEGMQPGELKVLQQEQVVRALFGRLPG